jgi:hypothetical protein
LGLVKDALFILNWFILWDSRGKVSLSFLKRGVMLLVLARTVFPNQVRCKSPKQGWNREKHHQLKENRTQLPGYKELREKETSFSVLVVRKRQMDAK